MTIDLQSGHGVPRQSLTSTFVIPEWFTTGKAVLDVFTRAPDMHLLSNYPNDDDPDDWYALDWRECLIPVCAFGLNLESLERFFASVPNCSDFESDMARVKEIEAWSATCGGVEQALDQSPVIVRLMQGRPKLEDGYHRLGFAAIQHGQTCIRGVCAYW